MQHKSRNQNARSSTEGPKVSKTVTTKEIMRRTITPTPVTMSSSPQITREINDPTPDVGSWRRTLRSPSPSAKFRLSPSMGRKNELTKTTDSFDFSRFQECLDRSLNDTTELEMEYVKSLKSQIQILEMDNSYLRGRGMQVSQMYPAMKLEAQAMLEKLNEMQARIEALDLEIFRKSGDVDRLTKVNDHLVSNMTSDMDVRSREKQSLMDDIVALKRAKDAAQRDMSKCDVVLQELAVDHTATQANLRAAETKIETLRGNLETQKDVTSGVERSLFEHRERLAALNTELIKAEKRTIAGVPPAEIEKEQLLLRQEIYDLRSRLGKASSDAEENLARRSELSADVGRQTKENIALTQLVAQMRTDLETIKNLRSSEDSKRSQEVLDISHMNNHIQELSAENDRLKADLETLKDKNIRSVDSMKRFEEMVTTTNREGAFTQKRLQDVEYSRKNLAEENNMLLREKNYLIGQVEAVQRKLQERNSEALRMDTHVSSLSKRLEELERLARMEQSVQSQRWAELARMADDVHGFAARHEVNGHTHGETVTSRSYNPNRYS